jgi:hypothetical protein
MTCPIHNNHHGDNMNRTQIENAQKIARTMDEAITANDFGRMIDADTALRRLMQPMDYGIERHQLHGIQAVLDEAISDDSLGLMIEAWAQLNDFLAANGGIPQYEFKPYQGVVGSMSIDSGMTLELDSADVDAWGRRQAAKAARKPIMTEIGGKATPATPPYRFLWEDNRTSASFITFTSHADAMKYAKDIADMCSRAVSIFDSFSGFVETHYPTMEKV